MRRGILLCALAAAAASAVVTPISFQDIAPTAGIRFVADNSATPQKEQPEGLLAGVALFDYDGDGYLDIYFVNGAGMPSLTKDGAKHQNHLFHNNRNLTFTDVTEKAGLAGAGYGMGVAVGDYDNDGRPDLYLPSLTGNQLFHNNGDGTFTDVTKKAGVGGGILAGKKMWSVAAAWVDYDNDGKLDLFVSNYCQWDPAGAPECKANGFNTYCSPRHYKPLPHTLYRNNGDGSFTDVSAATGIADHPGRGMGIAIADYDGDGFTDIFVANDSVQCFLYHNNGNGTFSEVGLLAGVGYNEDGKTFAGMGIDFSDYDNDGKPDIVVTDLSNERYMLFHNDGNGSFRDITNASGVGGATLAFSGWSTHFFDYDNDGWKDLFVAQSHVMDTIEKTSPNLHYMEPPLLLQNVSGHFRRVIAGKAFQQDWAGRGAAFGDIDNDGDIDIVVNNLGQRAYVLRNDGGNRNNWIGIQTVGTRSNRDGIGARIKVVSASGLTQYFTVNTAVGYLSASDKRVVAGLGGDSVAKMIEIRWPSGIVQKFENVNARQYLKAVEPDK